MFVIPETRFDEMDLDGLSASQTGLDTSNLENVANSSLSADFAAKVNADKVRLLLKANDALKTQVLKIQREQKDNVRVKRIKRLEAELEEKQIVFEAFKERLTSSGCTEADVQALVVKAIGGPARIRPPTVEELQAEIAQLKVDKLRVEKKLKSATTALVQGQTTAPSMATSVELLKSASASVLSASSNNAEHLKFVAVCAERDELKRCVEDQQRQLEEARESSRLQKIYEEKFKRSEAKRTELQADAERLHDELMNTLVSNEKYALEVQELRDRLDAADARMQELAESGAPAQQNEAVVQQLQRQLAAHEQQHQRDQTVAATQAKMIETLESTIAKLQNNEETLRTQVSTLRERIKAAPVEPVKAASKPAPVEVKVAPQAQTASVEQSSKATAEIASLKHQISELTTALADSQRSEGVAKEKFAKLQVRVRERLADLEHQIGAQTGGSNQQATTKEDQSQLRRELAQARRAAEQSDTMVKAKINELHVLHEHLNETTSLMHQQVMYTDQLCAAVAAHFVQAVQHVEVLEHALHEANIEVPQRPHFTPPEHADSELGQHAVAIVDAAWAAVAQQQYEPEESQEHQADSIYHESDHESAQAADEESITL